MPNKPKNLEDLTEEILASFTDDASDGTRDLCVEVRDLMSIAREVAHASLDAVGVEEMPIDKSLVEEHKDKVDEWLREGGKK